MVKKLISWHEKDIEDYVCENYKEMFGNEYSIIGRQIDVGVGIIDVLLYNNPAEELCVIEIKNQAICNNALSQVMRYIQGLTDYIYDDDFTGDFGVHAVRGILLGPDIKDETCSALRLVEDYIEYHEIKVDIVVNSKPVEFSRKKDSDSYNPKKFFESINEKLIEIREEFEVIKGE